MKKHFATFFVLTTLLLGACQTTPQKESQQPKEKPTPPPAPQTQEMQEPEREMPDLSGEGPWNGSLYMSQSSDGLNFSGKTLVLEHAGVPNLLQRTDGTLVLTYQYFSTTDIDQFDVIAYSTSTDSGKTWSDPQLITFENLPTPQASQLKPMDPTLVELSDGHLRLYFTYHAKGATKPALFSALSSSTELSSSFKVNSSPALRLTDDDLLDPAVVYFNDEWQHYSWKNDSDDNVHSTSSNGTSFTQQDDINLPMDFLGQVILYQEGLRFYGTGKGHIVVAESTDGNEWKIKQELKVQGADPGVAQLENGSYVMVYTSQDFN